MPPQTRLAPKVNQDTSRTKASVGEVRIMAAKNAGGAMPMSPQPKARNVSDEPSVCWIRSTRRFHSGTGMG